jgi:hypothetical protein
MRVPFLREIESTTKYYKKIRELNGWDIDNTVRHIEMVDLDCSDDFYILSDHSWSNLAMGASKDLVESVNDGKGLLVAGGLEFLCRS